MADNQYSFNAQAYLAANPDVAANAYYGANPYEHYINAGQKEGRQASFDVKPIELDPSQWESFQGQNNVYGEPSNYWKDPATGNVYSSNEEQRQLIASGDATQDKYAQLLGYSPERAQELYNLKNTDENAYYGQALNEINDLRFANYTTNENQRNVAYIDPVLEELKAKNPAEYYRNQAEYLGEQMGWQVGQNTGYRNEGTQKQLQELIPEALKAGLTTDEINQIVNTNLNQANAKNQQRIADDASWGGSGFNFQKDLLPGLALVGGAALGAYGLDAALAAGAAGTSAGAGSGALSTAEILGSTGFVPAAGSGASFAITPGAYGLAGGIGANALEGAGSYLTPELMGPTYGELGITGVEGGFAGPTYGEMGYTGLNQGQAIAQADAASQLAQLKEYASTAKDTYNNVNRAKKVANALTGNKATQQSISPNVLASLLSTPQAQFGGLYRMNEKPFLSTQQTASLSPDSYNVSGQNITSPTAPINQLLANLLYPKA